jgi:hypothetical protein
LLMFTCQNLDELDLRSLQTLSRHEFFAFETLS